MSLHIYGNETRAMFGEAGGGKDWAGKTLAGMLGDTGVIVRGYIIFNDETLRHVVFNIGAGAIAKAEARLNEYSKFELGARTFQEMRALEQDRQERLTLSREDAEAFEKQRRELRFQRTQLQNHKQTLDRSKEKAEMKETARKIAQLDDKLAELGRRRKGTVPQPRGTTQAAAP